MVEAQYDRQKYLDHVYEKRQELQRLRDDCIDRVP
jgi:hypothetical protein